MPVKPMPPVEEILFGARFWGARDIDHPLHAPRTFDDLLEACGVYPVHGGRDAVREIEGQIRECNARFGAKLAD